MIKTSCFIKKLCKTQLSNVFNPYSDRCTKFDNQDAPTLRVEQLSLIIENARKVNIQSIWIGRDLGHRGGRRTGLALTDDYTNEKHCARWGVTPLIDNHVYLKEQTASVIWSQLDKIDDNIFLWNIFPFHPHKRDEPFSNRNHNSIERAIGLSLLKDLMEMIKPENIIAIGGDAFAAVKKSNVNKEILKVRHPSYGGVNHFKNSISNIYRV